MDPHNRIGPHKADVLMFNKGGRDFRLQRLSEGQEVPREFFYGFFDLEKSRIRAAMMSSSGPVAGHAGRLADLIERGFASVTRLGVRPATTRLAAPWFKDARVLISFTDGFSLSLGLAFPLRRGRPILMGGFHGLSDIEERVPGPVRALARAVIRRSLSGLDHVFFFGQADRDFAVSRYGLASDRSSIIPFGIDTQFWRPLPDEPPADFVVAIGQDRNRDHDLLAAAPGAHPIVIVTRQPVRVPHGATHVRITAGDFFGSDSMSDEDVRRLYNQARAVVVPLRDVHQPSGYSVTLQAMSCGRPVILSNTRGLWAPQLLRDGENCLLVPPGDAVALGAAIGRVRADGDLAQRLGAAARATAIAHFGLDKIGQGTIALARLGLSLAERRPLSNGSFN